jgi:hypothetical protein
VYIINEISVKGKHEVLMTVNMRIGVFWDVRLYSWYRGTNILEEHAAPIFGVGE